jgi:hypothetical protein
LKGLNPVISAPQSLVEFVEPIKSGHQNDEVAGAGCSEERNPGDWTLLATANIKNLGKLWKFI